jgi:hypothetical protein
VRLFVTIIACGTSNVGWSLVVTGLAGVVSVRSTMGGEGRFSDDAEMSFRKLVEVVCELIARSDMDEVLVRPGALQRDEDD